MSHRNSPVRSQSPPQRRVQEPLGAQPPRFQYKTRPLTAGPRSRVAAFGGRPTSSLSLQRPGNALAQRRPATATLHRRHSPTSHNDTEQFLEDQLLSPWDSGEAQLKRCFMCLDHTCTMLRESTLTRRCISQNSCRVQYSAAATKLWCCLLSSRDFGPSTFGTIWAEKRISSALCFCFCWCLGILSYWCLSHK